MKLDGLLEDEIKKLKKVKINADPAKPTDSYIGYMLHENRKFLKIHEGILQSIGKGYNKLANAADKLKSVGQGDLGVLASGSSRSVKPKPPSSIDARLQNIVKNTVVKTITDLKNSKVYIKNEQQLNQEIVATITNFLSRN